MRYIDADKLQKDGWKLHREKHGLATSTFETMELDCVPTADVRENVKAHWIDMKPTGDSRFMCSRCKCKEKVPTIMGEPIVWDYCPNCGADMRGEA